MTAGSESLSHPAKETGANNWKDISAILDRHSGVAKYDQNKTNLVTYKNRHFKSGFNFLGITLWNKGDLAVIDLSTYESTKADNAALKKELWVVSDEKKKVETELTETSSELSVKKKELAVSSAELKKTSNELTKTKVVLTSKTAKLDECSSTVKETRKALSTYPGSSTEAPLNMVETDFSVQNDALNDFSATKSSLNTSLIVNYIQFGLIAVLATTVAYQYKGIETLKRVANGSDYQKM